LLGDKFLQMTYIDFHSVFQALMSNKIKFDDVKLYRKSLEVLTSEQQNAIKLLTRYTVDDFVATQNNKPRPAYPAGVPNLVLVGVKIKSCD
jgi:predicted RNA methylase